MRYVSIDIETTRLNLETDQIIEFAAVIDDTERPDVPVGELPWFSTVIKHDRIEGSPVAVAMNHEIIGEMSSKSGIYAYKLLDDFSTFLVKNQTCMSIYGHNYYRYAVAGKNFASFDRRFLERLPGLANHHPAHRVIDPGPMWMLPTDQSVPNLQTCVERATGASQPTKHRALDDARDVIVCVREFFKRRPIAGG